MAIRRFRLSVAFLALLAPAVSECQSDPALWRFVFPDAKALISIDWQRIRQSPAVAMLREKWLNARVTPSIPGIELLDDVDRILISSPGSGVTPQASDQTPAHVTDSPVLIAIHGHFDTARVHHFFTQLGAKAQSYNALQVYRPQGAKSMAWVLFDANTILFGDAPSVFAALDRNRFPMTVPEPGSMIARAAEMEANYDFWVALKSPDLFSSEQLAGLFRGSDLVSEAQGFEAGVSLRSGLAADVTVHLGSEASAKRLVSEMTRLMAAAAKDKNAEPPARDIAKKFKFFSDGPVAKIALRLTPEELEANARAFATAHPQGVFGPAAQASTVPSNTTMPQPVTPSKPAVIRIEGLDGGTVEIPYHQH